MSNKIYLYPVWIRSWHIINAILFLILMVTGLVMHYANPGVDKAILSFSTAVKWHNVSAIILIVNYLIFLVGNILSRNGRYYRKWRKNLIPNMVKQLRFYAFGVFRNEPHPFPVSEKQKFNPLQKFAYVIVMYFGMPLLIISGLGLLFPEIVSQTIFKVSGIIFYASVHVIVGYILSIFLIVHIYTCTLGEKPNTLFKSMVNGYHEEHA